MKGKYLQCFPVCLRGSERKPGHWTASFYSAFTAETKSHAYDVFMPIDKLKNHTHSLTAVEMQPCLPI